MKKLFLYFILAIALSNSNMQAQTFNIASYNLRFNNPNDGENAWVNRKDWVKHLIQYHEFDIFGTQEGLKDQLEDLSTIEGFAYVGVGRDDGKNGGEHSSIFYNKQRFKVLENGDFWFSETPDKPSIGWDAPSHKRICSWAKFRDNMTKKTFFVFSAHYDHKGVKAREESSKLVLLKIKEIAKDAPVFFVGDLNALPDAAPVKIIETELRDAFKASKLPAYGPVGTANGFNWERKLVDRIDYIFVNQKIEVLKYASLCDFLDNKYPSDHLPIVAKVLIK